MIVRTASFARRFFTALVLGTIAVPAVALAEPAPAKDDIALVSAARSNLAVVDQAIAVGVDKRNPIAQGEQFDASVGALYAWVKVKNLGEPTTITMVWKKEGKKKLAVELQVGHSVGWKTWSKKGIGPKDGGAWSVDVLDADGVLIDTLAFQIAVPSTVGAR